MTATTKTDSALPATDELQVHRYKWLQRWGQQDLYNVLDAGLMAHVGFVRDGKPAVIPMAYAWTEDALLMHGSTGAGLNRAAAIGIELAATISVFDGLVYAHSLFDSTVNYRCAVILGTAHPVPDDQKETAVKAISERLTPGRWEEVRPPTARELAATCVLQMPFDRASVKIRSGQPDDDAASGIWTGVLPFKTITEEPVTQDGVDCAVPTSLAQAQALWSRRLS